MLFLIPGILLSWYAYIFLTTEILSFFRLINIYTLFLSQTLFTCGLILLLNKKRTPLAIPKIKFWQIPLILLPILTFIQGFFSAPSTTDSMVYHLPRIMYWLQDGTVSQTYIRNSHDFMAPFAEYILLHLYSITNSDRLAFLSQWIAYLGSVVLILCISKKYFNIKNLWPIAALGLSLPIALLQSASTQTDLITTLFVLLSIYYSLQFIDNPNLKNIFLVGTSLGLGLLTKATFVIYILIPGFIILQFFISNHKYISKLIGYSLIILLTVLLIQLRFLNQNLMLYGSFSGQPILEEGSSYSNERIDPGVLVSNLLRNSFIHLPVPILSQKLTNLINGSLEYLGTSISDSKTTYSNTQFKVLPVIYPQEDIVSNPLHFILIITALIYSIIHFKKFENKNVLKLFYLALGSFLVFSLVLKWQPFHSRLHIPFLLIASTTGFILLSKSKLKQLLKIMLVLSVTLSFILIILNVSRPYISYSIFYSLVSKYSPLNASIPEAFYIKPRQDQYFNSRYYWQSPYTEVSKIINQDAKISFNLMDEYEYPFWVLLNENNLNFEVVKPEYANIIISTSSKEINLKNYDTKCFKTEIEYGYACISKKD